MGDDIEKLVDAIFSEKPIRHDCENCGESGLAAAASLPTGWRYVAVSDDLFDDLDDVDRNSLIVCAICFGLVTRILTKLTRKDN